VKELWKIHVLAKISLVTLIATGFIILMISWNIFSVPNKLKNLYKAVLKYAILRKHVRTMLAAECAAIFVRRK
jgi:hypothetical protein